ncbi:MAG: T9SS type A sorting domain-containing protein [Candidatus Cloacimonetes bacterium]|nr:T9SS type A sorting domain-containing protein [Candidatus Cloacimonadota bacterium]
MKNIVLIFLLMIVIIIPLQARRNIMMTGYWAPTSEMIYRFSDDPELNPDGWIGENWEDCGYDVYAFFPAFNRETREFEVDYQATWEDFWATVDIYNPIAIISYGAGAGPWEIEYNARNLSSWMNDYEYPYQPEPNPPDSTVPVNYVRHATLPVAEIEAAVDEQNPQNAWVDWNGNPGTFLCAYMAYLGMWYQDMHSSPEDEYPCLAAGFIHVSANVNLGYATDAAEITLRTVIEYLHNFVDLEGTVYADGANPAGTQITLISADQIEYNVTADENGEFTIELLPAGLYSVTAYLDRYYFYEGEANIDAENNLLDIVLQEYETNEPLTWCAEPLLLVNSAPNMTILIAGVYDSDDLAPYVNCQLRELNFTCGVDSTEADIQLILYQGTPEGEEPMEILEEENLAGYSAGDHISYWLEDENLLTDETWEQGLTLAYQITTSSGNIGWMDEGPAISGKGNMIKVSGQWMEAPDMLGVDGNWDISLGFYGDMVSEIDDNMISVNYNLVNYPNPFNPETYISYYAPDNLNAELAIYNIRGELVRKVDMSRSNDGRFSYCWKGDNQTGNPVATGVYLARVKSEKQYEQRKMLLIK